MIGSKHNSCMTFTSSGRWASAYPKHRRSLTGVSRCHEVRPAADHCSHHNLRQARSLSETCLTKGEGTNKHNAAVNDSQGGRARDADLHRQQASPSLYVRAATVEMHKVQESKAERKEQDHVDSEPLM